MNWQNIVGLIMAFLTVIMYMPQTYKVIKTKNVKGLSKTTFLGLYLAIVFYVNWSPMLMLWAAWVSNAILLILLLPIFYYLFKNDKKWFFAVIFLGFVSMTVSILQLIFVWKANSILSLIFSLIGGAVISVVFAPQVFIVIKNKSIGNMSIQSILLIILGNTIWTIYYVGQTILQGFNFSLIAQIIFCVIAVFMQFPMLIFYFKNKLQLIK